MMLSSEPVSEDFGLLALRLTAGGGMLYQHGWPKLAAFSEKMDTFYDPTGFSPALALTLIVIAEVGCSVLVMLGLWTRISTIPVVIGMAVAAFMAKGGQGFGEQELPILYMVAFLTIFFTGSGRFSIDRLKFQ